MSSIRAALAALMIAGLSGCTVVDYGKVRHADYASAPECNPSTGQPVSDSRATPYFFVTSRLPDCRSTPVQLLQHRSPTVRYGHMGEPATIGKGPKTVPIRFDAREDWWQALAAAAKAKDGRVLIYVHGYRENFLTNTESTVQMVRLTGFDGPVIQYSWPSQGALTKYVVDETNMYWDERNFRTFLQQIARQDWVKEIVLVSHSLGARLVIPAVEFVDANSSSADSSNISNIILASPDVDREDFERDIAEEVLAPRRVAKDRRITVYASLSDKALAISRQLHGYPRLGSPYCFDPFERADLKAKGLPARCYPVAKSGLTIVDTTDVSSGGSGHSDFLKSAPACLDFAAVVRGNREGAGQRAGSGTSGAFVLKAAPKGQKADDKAVCRF